MINATRLLMPSLHSETAEKDSLMLELRWPMKLASTLSHWPQWNPRVPLECSGFGHGWCQNHPLRWSDQYCNRAAILDLSTE
ncbi:uncharacterized protein VTP21DRAFT_4180 [Calcarisporiella thermophila]|uniref:uncharacterized protein n=1 Tax=Calcarisporiella thermophila TaxID=911321 RepID=UPI003743C4D6